MRKERKRQKTMVEAKKEKSDDKDKHNYEGDNRYAGQDDEEGTEEARDEANGQDEQRYEEQNNYSDHERDENEYEENSDDRQEDADCGSNCSNSEECDNDEDNAEYRDRGLFRKDTLSTYTSPAKTLASNGRTSNRSCVLQRAEPDYHRHQENEDEGTTQDLRPSGPALMWVSVK